MWMEVKYSSREVNELAAGVDSIAVRHSRVVKSMFRSSSAIFRYLSTYLTV